MEMISYSCEEERTYSMLCHLAALAGILIPFCHIICPLVVWFIKKKKYPEIDRQGKAALKFQISATNFLMISGILALILIGLFLLAVIGIFALVVTIIASVRSSNGERFDYPLSIKIIQ